MEEMNGNGEYLGRRTVLWDNGKSREMDVYRRNIPRGGSVYETLYMAASNPHVVTLRSLDNRTFARVSR
ncbi:MAG: hypothetical protein HYY37_02935 [Candidatus Aenigmarchaeota archaeon]|nr:hypothetical protein [Candidatus Aenigmarchaeota archaeon]